MFVFYWPNYHCIFLNHGISNDYAMRDTYQRLNVIRCSKSQEGTIVSTEWWKWNIKDHDQTYLMGISYTNRYHMSPLLLWFLSLNSYLWPNMGYPTPSRKGKGKSLSLLLSLSNQYAIVNQNECCCVTGSSRSNHDRGKILLVGMALAVLLVINWLYKEKWLDIKIYTYS